MEHYTVCIIGGGFSGIAAAKQLLCDEGLCPRKVIVVDETSKVGGMWNRCARGQEKEEFCDVSSSPVYDDLHTNLPKDFMAFSDFPYDASIDHYPSHLKVKEYLEAYTRKFIPVSSLCYDTTVNHICKQNNKWIVNCTKTREKSYSFTAENIIVCTGHYRYPLIPSFDSTSKLISNVKVVHSSTFVRASDWKQYRNIVVVGSSASAKDICLQMLQYGKAEGLKLCVTVCVRNSNMSMPQRKIFVDPMSEQGAIIRGAIQHIDYQNGNVQFSDGETAPCVDLLVYATGYVCKFPFIDFSSDGKSSSDQSPSVLPPLFNYVFYMKDPSLSFIGSNNLLLSPGMCIEYQSRYVAQVISGKISLPSFLDILSSLESGPSNWRNNTAIKTDEYDMSAKVYLNSPWYCNRLAQLTKAQGYWSQLLGQRLFWYIKSTAYHLFCYYFRANAQCKKKI